MLLILLREPPNQNNKIFADSCGRQSSLPRFERGQGKLLNDEINEKSFPHTYYTFF